MRATGLWTTHHGLKKIQRERADMQDWLGRVKHDVRKFMNDHKTNKEIELILFEKEAAANRLKRVDDAVHLPSVLPRVRVLKNTVD